VRLAKNTGDELLWGLLPQNVRRRLRYGGLWMAFRRLMLQLLDPRGDIL
jgi:hypothetical protein